MSPDLDLPEHHYPGEKNDGDVVLASMPGGPDPYTGTHPGESFFRFTQMASCKKAPFSVSVVYEKSTNIATFWALYNKGLKEIAESKKIIVALTLSDRTIGKIQQEEIPHMQSYCSGKEVHGIKQPDLRHLTKLAMTVAEFEAWVRLGLGVDKLGGPAPVVGFLPSLGQAQRRWLGLAGVPIGFVLGGGDSHSVALRADGALVQWGGSSDGLREGLPQEGKFVAVACGACHSVALRSDGALVHSVALRSDGALVHSVALRSDGALVQWGDGSRGQREGLPQEGKFVAVACGLSHSVALRSDGALVQWGGGSRGQREGLPREGKFVAVACGGWHSVALRADGALVQWGGSSFGQREGLPPEGKFVAVACGFCHSVALRSDGALVQWGHSSNGQREGLPAALP